MDFNDAALTGIFRFDLNDHLNYLIPKSNILWIIVQHLNYALLLRGSSYTVGFADDEPLNPTVYTKPPSRHFNADSPVNQRQGPRLNQC